jgi:hypothetical protein
MEKPDLTNTALVDRPRMPMANWPQPLHWSTIIERPLSWPELCYWTSVPHTFLPVSDSSSAKQRFLMHLAQDARNR